jgi:hypothetical protein
MTRRKALLWLAIGIPVAIVAFAGSIAFVILRTLESSEGTPESAAAAFDAVRRQFPQRPPLVEFVNLKTGDVRINRVAGAPRKAVNTLHFMMWNPSDREIVRGSAPAWLLRMRLSLTGIGNWSFSDLHVTNEDIERYAPGVILDLKAPGGEHVLVWAPASEPR